MNPIREEDLELAGAFVDGEMSEDERTRFELRLSVETELALHVERLMSTDELVRRHASGTMRSSTRLGPTGAIRRPRWRVLSWPTLLAAAAAILAFVGLRALWRDDAPRTRAAEVAIAESFESAAEWIARVPELADQRPPGLDDLRGENAPPNADPRAFVDAALRAEMRSFGDAATETTGTFFVLSVRAEEPTEALVFGFPRQGSGIRYWPDAADARGSAARLARGDHVLPAPSFRLVEDSRGARVEYQRGFLVPIGAEQLEVLVATRTAGPPLDGEDLAIGVDAARTAARLRAAGFTVRTLVVREP